MSKRKYMGRILALCVLLGLLPIADCTVRAESGRKKQYIVYFKEEYITLHEGNAKFCLLDEVELEECVDAGVVDWYEEDYEVELFETQEGVSASEWECELIQAEWALELGCTGQEIRVGVIDSGVIDHPDLSSNILGGYNYLAASEDVADNMGHGTFVSGLIAAEDNNIGITGVAPDAKIVPLKCFDTGETTRVSTICSAIYGAVDDYGCDVINMSLGLKNYSQNFETAIKYAIDNGVCIVASVGNAGGTDLYYPAAFEGVIGVGSVDSKSAVSSFSQKNDSVLVVAPGEEVCSTDSSGGYSRKSGTSFAAPMVSGAVAALLSIDNDLTPAMVADVLSSTAEDDAQIAGYDHSYGYGVMSCRNAAEYVLRGIKYFISPARVENDVACFTVYNNTQEVFNAELFIVCYRGSVMSGLDLRDIVLGPQETIQIPCGSKTESMRVFLWRSISDIAPIAQFRKWEME